MSEKADIDFVILWVDDQDPIWIEDKNKYKGQQGNHTNNEVRYRDWQNLKYWFRAVEKYAPWVRKIHFVTCGQKPEWLNINHPKLNLVDHKDYIDEKYLPTFSSHTIANITVIGYISLIINAFMNNHFGFMLLKISGDALAQKNGYIRIVDCAVFTPLVIAYLFSNSVVHNRKLDFFKMCIVLLGQIYVEKTRMGTIALLFMLIAMLLFSKKNKFSKILTWIFLILGGFFSIAGGMIDQILSKFSIQNNGNSTLYRLNEIQFYMSHFIENKLLGIGIISPEKIMNEYGIAYWQNHNYEDIGIIGFLGIAGIVGIIVIYIIPIIRMLFVLQSVKGKISSYSEYLMLIGMFCYIIVTSATLMIVNYQRMPCFAICIALFEYIYVSCNKLEMKGIHKCY